MGFWGWLAVGGGGLGLLAFFVWRYPKLSDGLGSIGDAIGDIDFGSSDSGGDSGGC